MNWLDTLAAHLHCVETIREFVASATVTLILDLPFLLIFPGFMFYCSVLLTCVALGIISLIVILSFIVTPILRSKLCDNSCSAHATRPSPPNTS